MERELWSLVTSSLRTLPRRRLRNAVYTDEQVLAVLLWAAIHQRPVSWACKRSSWPVQAWRRRLPDQSTMSRRLRDPRIPGLMRELARRIQRRLPPGRVLMTDGKAFALEDRTHDPDAAVGRASGRFARGYKLHAIVDDHHRVCAWRVMPMNHAEQTQARALLGEIAGERRGGRCLLLGDAGYNSNALFTAARGVGLRLIAPRCRPETGLGSREHDRDRITSMRLTEQRGGWMGPMLHGLRTGVERYFSGLSSGVVSGGHLPPWARGLHRVRYWIAAKIIINAARVVRNQEIRA